MRFKVKAPANIALIKYMGKVHGSANQPENSSISMTLNNLCTTAVIEPAETETRLFSAVTLDEKSVNKIKTHMKRLDAKLPSLMEINTHPVSLHTQNSFPAGTGIASSASSFAAITVAYSLSQARSPEKFFEKFLADDEFRSRLADLSREGSGSSCRSFFGPITEWDEKGVRALDSKLEPLIDLVVVVDSKPKTVSSSEAHERVKTSPMWEKRKSSVTERFSRMKSAIVDGDLKTVAALSFDDAMEMHELFHTSKPGFSYMAPLTHAVLDYMSMHKTPEMIITLDAGPNVHIILPKMQALQLRQKLASAFPMFHILDDKAGTGPTFEVMG
ncbi:MAG: hypothetical protein KA715_03610 [Xanthomonadaceae bacterium]|nr:hypothetical protein [Xanthomonadaceae bacterium]